MNLGLHASAKRTEDEKAAAITIRFLSLSVIEIPGALDLEKTDLST